MAQSEENQRYYIDINITIIFGFFDQNFRSGLSINIKVLKLALRCTVLSKAGPPRFAENFVLSCLENGSAHLTFQRI